MKLRLFAAALLCGALIAPAFAAPKGGDKKAEGKAGIAFTQTVHDFGTIPEDGKPVSTTFEFENTGDAPLVIVSASAACGCTHPEYPRHPIKPGKKDKIKVTYSPKGRPGEFSKTVTIRSNAKGKKKVVLKIKGNVTPAAK